MTTEVALKITRKVLNENKLEGWKATTNNRKTAFGLCSYKKKEVQLSSILTPNCTDEAVMNTIYHEVAHALTQGHKHDYYWRRKCIELGGNGERCGDESNYIDGDREFLLKNSKYTLVCPVCGYKIAKSRKPKNRISCGKHGRKFDSKYVFQVIQNY